MSGYERFQTGPPAKLANPAKVDPETADLSNFSHFSRGGTPEHETIATCQITGDVCRIVYSRDLFRKHGHRNGQTIDIDGVPLTLKIEETTA